MIGFALRKEGVSVYLVKGVMSHKGCKTAVSVNGNYQVHFL